MSWDQYLKINPFNNANYNVGGVKGGNNPFGGGQTKVNGAISTVAQDIQNAKGFFGAYNGTGELRPKNDEPGAFFQGVYF